MNSQDKLYYASKRGAEIGNRIVTGLTILAGLLLFGSIVFNVIFS